MKLDEFLLVDVVVCASTDFETLEWVLSLLFILFHWSEEWLRLPLLLFKVGKIVSQLSLISRWLLRIDWINLLHLQSLNFDLLISSLFRLYVYLLGSNRCWGSFSLNLKYLRMLLEIPTSKIFSSLVCLYECKKFLKVNDVFVICVC